MTSQVVEPERPTGVGRPGAGGRGFARTPRAHDTRRPRALLQVLPAVPDSLRHARVGFTEWLAQLQWPTDDADDLILAVNEAVANVIDHAYPAADPGPLGLHAWSSAGSTPATRRVTITVTDHGDWRREHRTVDPAGRRGHGFALMSACTAKMHIQRSAGGTTVTLVSKDAPTIELLSA
jgi:serine/threonine-protein kinase RsbW